MATEAIVILLADHKLKRAAYARNITRADLTMSQYCGDIMKKRLETQPDYGAKIRDKGIAALQQIKVFLLTIF